MLRRILSAVIAVSLVMGMCSCSHSSSSEPSPGQPDSSFAEPTEPTEPDVPIKPDPVPQGDVIDLTSDLQFTPMPNDHSKTYDAEFIKGIGGFSTELFKNTVKDDLSNGEKNTLVSPASVAFALGMTENGAGGKTLEQMQNVLCKGVDTDKFNENMKRWLSRSLTLQSENSRLDFANAVWVNDKGGITPTQQFAKACKEMYNASVFRSEFNDKTAADINNWVSQKTNGMIPSIIDGFEGNEASCLLNCAAFDAKWIKPYEESQIKQNEKFTNAKGEEIKCTMLESVESDYIENGRATGFVKRYNGKYSFMAVLPNEDKSIGDFVSALDFDELSELYASRKQNVDVYAKLPQFKFDYSSELGNTLKNMGMSDAFSAGADFSNMFENAQMKIDRVLHKTHIELDAQGTKAAAATAVTNRNMAMQKEDSKTVHLDRPFVFAIMDTELGVPVFIGTVGDPTVQ